MVRKRPSRTPPERLTREAQKARTREALVAAATRRFAERGIEATSLDDVALAAGFTKGAIYAHFPNKRALIDAVTAHQVVGIDPAPLLREDLPMPERLALMGASAEALLRGLPPEAVLLDLEYSLDRLRHRPARRAKGATAPAPVGESDVLARFAALNAAQGARPALDDAELVAVMGMLVRGYARALAETPDLVRLESLPTVFRLLAGDAASPAPRTKRARGR